jgi:hypothetical protein
MQVLTTDLYLERASVIVTAKTSTTGSGEWTGRTPDYGLAVVGGGVFGLVQAALDEVAPSQRLVPVVAAHIRGVGGVEEGPACLG